MSEQAPLAASATLPDRPSRTLAMSNTPITENDRLLYINPGFGMPPINSNYTQSLIEGYQYDIYPRYLFTTAYIQIQSFGLFTLPVQYLHIWHDPNTVDFHFGFLNGPNINNEHIKQEILKVNDNIEIF